MQLPERVAKDEQKAQLIGPLARGGTRSVFLMTEPDNGAGSDPSLLRTRAERVQGGWRLSGHKWLLPGDVGARLAIIMSPPETGATMFTSTISRDLHIVD